MSEIYKKIEKEVEQLETIENWNDRVNRMKEIKEQISFEQERLGELINMILKDDIKETNKKKKYDKLDLENLVNNFKQTDNIDEKIKYYHLITNYVNNVEKQLFS
jgi:hypothetical protein